MVWITRDVDLPQAVLDAHATGRLVLFVGAGASVSPPSDLPLFKALTRKIAELARVPFDDKQDLDRFLGALPENVDTHAHVRRLIAREDSRPNAMHVALVNLASANSTLRIVTTNFDDHLHNAATSESVSVPDKWVGPALPLGGSFAGIVHLHGSVLRSPDELVLTDSDFGRAYLTHAWATRFLLSMFQEYTVLFVGYSHDDPIMRYLALGLPARSLRFVFVGSDVATDRKWSRLDVKPIAYPVVDNDHQALVDALEAWNTKARMGRTDHYARMNQIVGSGPTMTPTDRDYMLERLGKPEGAQDFIGSSTEIDIQTKASWLAWLGENIVNFKLLFAGVDSGGAATILKIWFCDQFIQSSELHGVALQTVQRLGQTFSDGLFQSASWSANELAREDAIAGQRWKALLATSIYGQSAPSKSSLMLSDESAANHLEHASILRAALRPHLELARAWMSDVGEESNRFPPANVSWIVGPTVLSRQLQEFILAEPVGDARVEAMMHDALGAAYDLIDAYYIDGRWDKLSYKRSAIEPHEQDQFPDALDSLIDALRTYGERALLSRPELPERWWLLGRALPQRLALHLLCADDSRTSDEKLTWVLDRAALYDTDLKHEVYRLLALVTNGASGSLRARVLEMALEGPTLREEISDVDRHRSYAIYNLVGWLTQNDSSWVEAAQLFEALQADHPEFGLREHPDLDSWMTSGILGQQLPVEPEVFVRALTEDADAALDELLARDYSDREFGQPSWSDALELVRRVAESHPKLSNRLWTCIDSRPEVDTAVEGMRESIIEGWAKAELGLFATEAITRVASQVAKAEAAYAIGTFLLEQIRLHIDYGESHLLKEMRELAHELWEQQATWFTDSSEDPVSGAALYLNSWPGDLAHYWMAEVDRRWRRNRDTWTGLNDDERNGLAELLGGPPATLDATAPALAGQIFFLFAADQEFVAAHVLPLFIADKTSRLAWSPYLHHPRFDDRLLEAGLLDAAIAQWDRLETLDQHLQQEFFRLISAILSFAAISAEARQELLDRSVLASDGGYASRFAESVVRMLGEERVKGSEVWTQWLAAHVKMRLDGIPRLADEAELAEWANIVPYLGDKIVEALPLFGGRAIPLGSQYFHFEFAAAVLEEHGSALVEYFSERIRNTTPGNHQGRFQVRRLIEAFRDGLGEPAAASLTNVAIAKGLL